MHHPPARGWKRDKTDTPPREREGGPGGDNEGISKHMSIREGLHTTIHPDEIRPLVKARVEDEISKRRDICFYRPKSNKILQREKSLEFFVATTRYAPKSRAHGFPKKFLSDLSPLKVTTVRDSISAPLTSSRESRGAGYRGLALKHITNASSALQAANASPDFLRMVWCRRKLSAPPTP